MYIHLYVYIYAQPYLKQCCFQELKNPLTTASMDSVYFLQHNDMKMQRPVIVKKTQPHSILGA